MKTFSSAKHLIFVLLIVALQVFGCRSCLDDERMGLLELKTFFNNLIGAENGRENILSSWSADQNSNCCDWERVKCSRATGHVIELSLDGLVPPAWNSPSDPILNLSLLHSFEELQSLNFSSNQFVGLFDDVEGYRSFARLKNLKILNFAYNRFNNSILPFLGAAASVRTLVLEGNLIEGVFPPKGLTNMWNLRKLNLNYNSLNVLSVQGADLADFRELEILDLSHNEFIGSLADKVFSNLTNLRALDLSDNEFSGYLQMRGICKLKNLWELDLSGNLFKGHLPHCLGNMTRLRTLDVSFNQLSGNLPSVVPDMPSLEYLSLLDNNFEGPFMFSLLANQSTLKVFRLSSKPGMVKVQTKGSWIPAFQLKMLQLRNCDLSGSIPSFLLHQYNLRYIDLSHNRLVGPIPAWLLQNSPKLEAIHLRKNSLTDLQLPKLPHGLHHLDISDNKIVGSVPESIGIIFPRLKYMNVSNNNLRGVLPSSMGEMKVLQTLVMSSNNLSGELPRNFVSGCSSLSVLKLSNNNFQGQVFAEYANLTRLEFLLLDSNKFTGNIREGLFNSVFLYALDMSNNMLSGRIPHWISRFENLSYLRMGKNRIEGSLPFQLLNLTSLTILDLSDNMLSGYIPHSFNLPYLRQVSLQNNELVGSIPDALFVATELEILDLRNNKLSGKIPKSIGMTFQLDILLLRGNRLRGNIPKQMCQLREINLLDLSHNRFHGSIPSCLSKMSFGKEGGSTSSIEIENSMGFGNGRIETYTNEDYDVLDALITADFLTKSRYESFQGNVLRYMFGLDLSSNELSGDIPPHIGRLHKIRSLNLSHNHLMGCIPENISNLKNIESLDLSYNRLNGNIPVQLGKLNNLGNFNVSYNNLSGMIPFKGHLAAFDESSYLGNANLCGLPTNRSCGYREVPKTTASQHHEKEQEDDDPLIDMLWFYWSSGASYVTVLLGLCVFLCIDSRWSQEWFYRVELCIFHLQRLKRTSKIKRASKFK